MILSADSRNPFDRRFEPEAIRVLVGPAFLSEASSTDLQELSALGGLALIQLSAVATTDALAAEFERLEIPTARVERGSKHVVLRTESSVSALGLERTLALFEDWAPHVDGAALEHLLAVWYSRPGYLLGSAAAIETCPDRDSVSMYVSMAELKDHLRLLSVMHGDFEIAPRFSIDESAYFNYRRKHLFTEVLRASVYGRKLAAERFDSLWTRLEFICRASDSALIQALGSPTNSKNDKCLFHLAFQYMLATGVLDDLTAITMEVYGIEIENRTWRTLRRRANQEVTEFRSAVADRNPELYSYLESDRVNRAIESFYPIRDELQHREFPVVVSRSVAGRGTMPSGVLLPPEPIQDLAFALSVPMPDFAKLGSSDGRFLVDLDWVVRGSLKVLADLVNGYVSRVPWRELSPDADFGDKFMRSFSRSIDFGVRKVEPLFF